MKRACPFDANLLRSSKVHFMNYDLDACAKTKMYEETLKKLQDGARNVLPGVAAPTIVSPIDRSKKVPKQQLMSSYFKGFDRETTKIKPMVVDASEIAPCAYCDKKDSTFPCIQCGDYFCSSCSFICYESYGEAFVCMTCS